MRLSEYRRRIEKVMLTKCPRKVKGSKDSEGKEKEVLTPWLYVNGRNVNGVFELAFRVPPGYSYLDLEKQVDAFYAAVGAVVQVKDYAGVVELHIFPEDFPALIPYHEEQLALAKGKEILIGFNRQGVPVVHSLRVPHLLIAGKSGYGKTDLIRFLMLQLIAHNTPEEVEIWIVDLKGFSFMPFKNIPHITRIVRDLSGAVDLLEAAVRKMESRSNEVWNTGDRTKAGDFKKLYVLIDEAYMIAPKLIRNKELRPLAQRADEAAAKISGTGREAGVGLLYCTQRPDSDVINPLVKANMDCKICFKTETESNSEIVLDRSDAARLPHGKAGRVLYSRDGLEELQVPYVGGDDEWVEVMKKYKKNSSFLDSQGTLRGDDDDEEETKDETEGASFDISEGNSPILDGTSSEIFYPEWQPVQEGERATRSNGKGKAARGEEEGNRQEQALAPVLDWTQIFKR